MDLFPLESRQNIFSSAIYMPLVEWRPLALYCLWVFENHLRVKEKERAKNLLGRRKLTLVRMEACTLELLMKSLLPNYVKKHNMFGMRSAQLLTDTKEPSTAKERQHKHAERRKASGKKQSKRVRENKLSGHFTEKKNPPTMHAS